MEEDSEGGVIGGGGRSQQLFLPEKGGRFIVDQKRAISMGEGVLYLSRKRGRNSRGEVKKGRYLEGEGEGNILYQVFMQSAEKDPWEREERDGFFVFPNCL